MTNPESPARRRELSWNGEPVIPKIAAVFDRYLGEGEESFSTDISVPMPEVSVNPYRYRVKGTTIEFDGEPLSEKVYRSGKFLSVPLTLGKGFRLDFQIIRVNGSLSNETDAFFIYEVNDPDRSGEDRVFYQHGTLGSPVHARLLNDPSYIPYLLYWERDNRLDELECKFTYLADPIS